MASVSSQVLPGSGGRPLRRDALENRERILSAAREVFAARGLEASVEEIAQRAQVGMGTLYRRFPGKKAALVDSVFENHLDELVASAERALAEPDPWEGLRRFLERAVSLQAENRGFAEICAVDRGDTSLLAKARVRVRPLLCKLIERAQAAGELRLDISYEDISILLWTSGRVVDSTRDTAPDYWRRYLTLTLDGLRALNSSTLEQPPLTIAQHRRVMGHLARQLHLERPTAEPGEPG